MEFAVRTLKDKPDVVEVRYDCSCGCKPRARYQRGTEESGHEHCCCGRVHFVGDKALQQLDAYLQSRRVSGEDARSYRINVYGVKAPWGSVAVAYGEPDRLTPH